MLPSSFLGELVAACGTYQDVWSDKDERANPSQTFYRDMIQQEKEREVSTTGYHASQPIWAATNKEIGSCCAGMRPTMVFWPTVRFCSRWS